MTRSQFYQSLRLTVPQFADEVERLDAALLDPDLPLPLEAVSGEAVSLAFFPDTNGVADTSTPLGVATLWWRALETR